MSYGFNVLANLCFSISVIFVDSCVVLFAYNSVICIVVICANFVLLGLLHTFRFSTDRELNGRATAQFETLIFPVLTGQSKDQDSCDQAVVPAE